ncbi:hypothetical protein INR49_004220 [Caranx melampygus]|nr:hypothetical protein INR49_004220 [Caranx melampygus]
MLKAVGQALFSTGLQNPKFTEQEKKGEDYEIRTYHDTKWVSTTVSGMQLDAAMNTASAGSSEVKVEMTAPVTCRVEPGDGPACESQFIVSFYIQRSIRPVHQSPVTPTCLWSTGKSSQLMTHGGFSNENMKREELVKLLESLQRDGVPYTDKPYYVAGYDSPFKLTNRRNEVWVLKKE